MAHRSLILIPVRVGCVDVEVFRAARISDEALEGAHDDGSFHKLDHFLNNLTNTRSRYNDLICNQSVIQTSAFITTFIKTYDNEIHAQIRSTAYVIVYDFTI